MNKFSIKIDLSTFFEDERKMVLIMVDPMWENVKSLQKRIEDLFDVDSVRFLNIDGCFLPPQEPIEIVRFCKELKAFIPKASLDKMKRKKSKKDKNSLAESDSEKKENDETAVENVDNEVDDESQKKRKYRSLECGFASSTPNNRKRIKNYSSIGATLMHHKNQINKSSEITSTSEEMPPPSMPTPSVSSTRKMKKSNNVSSAITKDDNADVDIASQQNGSSTYEVPTKSKRKQKSSKQAEEKSSKQHSVEASDTPTERITSLPSSTFINDSRKSKTLQRSTQNPFKNQSSDMNHIRFDESGAISTTENNTLNKENDLPSAIATPKIVFHSTLQETDAKTPRIFHTSHSDAVANKSLKPKILIQENIILKPVVSQNSLSASQVFEATQMNTNDDESVANASLASVFNGDLEKSMVNDISCMEREEETNIDKGNSSVIDNSISTPSTTIDNGSLISMEVSKLNENNQSSHISDNKTAAGEKSPAEEIANQSVQSEDDLTSSHCKDENESSILPVDCVDLSLDLDEDDGESKHKKKRMKSSTNIQDISISDTSDVEEISEVIDLNESEEQSSTYSSVSAKNKTSPTKTIKVIKIIGLCQDTKELPNIDDIMIFKVPFVNRKGNPDCTKFLAGKVERIQHRTKSIKLLILDGQSELCYVPAKYIDNFLENSTCEDKYIQIKYSEMIQPRILPKNKRSLFAL